MPLAGTVTDDNGTRWIVEKGDPGFKAFAAAKALRIKNPIFPHEVLLGHRPAEPDWAVLERMVNEGTPLHEMRSVWVANLIRKQLRREWKSLTD